MTDQIVQSLTDADLGEIMSVALVKRGYERDTADLLIWMSLEFVAHLKKGALGEFIVFSIVMLWLILIVLLHLDNHLDALVVKLVQDLMPLDYVVKSRIIFVATKESTLSKLCLSCRDESTLVFD